MKRFYLGLVAALAVLCMVLFYPSGAGRPHTGRAD